MGQSVESVEASVREILEELRPFVQKDDGDISFEGIHNGIVDIRMTGECETCPNSEATLKVGAISAEPPNRSPSNLNAIAL